MVGGGRMEDREEGGRKEEGTDGAGWTAAPKDTFAEHALAPGL